MTEDESHHGKRTGRPPKSTRSSVPETPGDYIRIARERAGLSQRALAERVRWHWHTVMRLETGQTSITEERLRVIAHALNLQPGEIAAPGTPLHREWDYRNSGSYGRINVPLSGIGSMLPPAPPGLSDEPAPWTGPSPGGIPKDTIVPATRGRSDFRAIAVLDWLELALRPDWSAASSAVEHVMWDVHGYESDQIAAARVPSDSATAQVPEGAIAIINRSIPVRLGLDRSPPTLAHLPLAMVYTRGRVRICRIVARRGELLAEAPDTGSLVDRYHADTPFRVIGSILGAISFFS